MAPITRRNVLLASSAAAVKASVQATSALPKIRLGNHDVSRLIVGGNPVSGNSHLSRKVDLEMRDYFTSANIKKLLGDCEAAGINTWQSRADRHIMRLLNEYRMEGGTIQWIAQTASEYGSLNQNLKELMGMRPVAIYHHGSITDRLWNEGKIGELRDRLKAICQTGVPVGLGTHMPEVVERAETEGWDIDFYMTCVYRIIAGDDFADNREKMLRQVAKVSKPCLIFKVYAASRNCGSTEAKQDALNLAFRFAKPGDAVVIGMFPKYQEQVRENCRLVLNALART
jgi:hypothetical protein